MQLPHSALTILERGGVIVTANARAARDMRRLFGEQQQAAGRKAWSSPAISDLHGWLAAEWQRLLLTGTEERLLLSGLQEESVWTEIVQPAIRARSLLSPGEVARQAQRAYGQLAAYGGPTGTARLGHAISNYDQSLGEASDPLEQEWFRGWARAFERRCERRGWLSSALLPWVLADAYRLQKLEKPVAIGWCGFDRVTPAENALRDAMKNAGSEQHEVRWDLAADEWRVTTQTCEHELEACAHWVQETLTQQPGARIGVLVQDVAAVRAALDRTFRRILTPANCGLREHPQKPVYEFTLGMPLADVPMVRAALLLLRWMAAPLEQAEISWLMTTGFFGNPAEAIALAEADAKLRRKELLAPEQEMDAMLQRLAKSASTAWLRCMKEARSALEPLLNKERSFRQWVASVDTMLTAAGWPGGQKNDSVVYQVRERWQRALQEVAGLDFAETRVPFERFLDFLRQHLRSLIFSAASEDAPVSISGIHESAGRAFDAVWMLQATDEALPSRSSALAMLPGWLQKELGMPRGDAREDYAFSNALMGRLRSSTRKLIFSYAREGETGAQRAAALTAGLREEVPATGAPAANELLTEIFDDAVPVPWPADLLAPGGSRTLKMQAACPFQAFAEKRLGGQDTRDSEHGLDARRRGSLLHLVLQTLWDDERMKGSEGLKRLIFSQQLQVVIQQHVKDALNQYRQEASSWELEYLALEEQRLCQLTQDWLTYESQRTPFTVEQVEVKQEIQIAGLRLSVRMDRIDKLEDGRILIDYKTGKPKYKEWLGERPDEPQLPLYAIAGNVDDLRDVYFAVVRPAADERRLIGAVSGNAGRILPNSKQPAMSAADADAAFGALRHEWRNALEGISLEFLAGVATVSPKESATTCKFCPFSGLCRVAETKQVADTEEDEA